MRPIVSVNIHASQFPNRVRQDLIDSIRSRCINHKFHYDSIKQTQKWLAMHEAYSPARTDSDCLRIYDEAFSGTAKRIEGREVQLIGLGCGGGQKDARLIELLRAAGKTVTYIPVDVAVAMVLVAHEKVVPLIGDENSCPTVCDLATAENVGDIFSAQKNATRLVTFFGMIPNFEPDLILPKLSELLGDNDSLLFSANLAPGGDYQRGVERILPLYDNTLTHEWLFTFLADLGVEKSDGTIRFSIEDIHGLKRVVAHFEFSSPRTIRMDGEAFEFRSGDGIRLFFSYRHTPEIVRTQLSPFGIKVQQEWVTKSEEEGVFLCRKV